MLNCGVWMGRLTADPELRTTNTGTSVTSFSIAVERKYQSNGQREADFFPVVAWRQNAEFICRYFQKGSMIAIQGYLQNRKYEAADSTMRTVTEIVVEQVSFCGNKTENSGTTRYDTHPIADSSSEWSEILGDYDDFDDEEDYFEQVSFK